MTGGSMEYHARPDRRMVLGNWKMNGLPASLGMLTQIASAAGEQAPLIGIAVPHPMIAAAAAIAPELVIGAQDVHERRSGAHTGCVSAEMVKACGASFAIVGHSERREQFGETAAIIRDKVRRAQEAGLRTVICCGEPGSIRQSGSTVEYVIDQLAASIPPDADAASLTIAYEPCWAIGTGATPSQHEIAAIHDAIRIWCSREFEAPSVIPVIYGGSVDPSVAAELVRLPAISGFLVGGASLKTDQLLSIIHACHSGQPNKLSEQTSFQSS